MGGVFTSRIKLGNDAMQTSEELASALENIAKRIRDNNLVELLESISDDKVERVVSDANGQKVGTFQLKAGR